MPGDGSSIWLAAGLRTPFVGVDGPFAARDSLALSVPVVQAMAAQASGPIDFGVWGFVVGNLAYSNLAREVWLDAKLDPHVPTFTTIMQCSTSMVAAFEAAGMLGARRAALALVGGVDSMTRVQIGLGMNLSVWLRRVVQARSTGDRLRNLSRLRSSDIRLYIPEVKNRVTGRSMGEHTEDMAKDWKIGRTEQDELALEGHRRAVAAQDRGFFADLIVPVDGVDKDHFPRRDTSMEKLAKLKPAFDRTSGRGTITAGNSSPLTDGAAGLWVATEDGLARLPAATPRARLVDFEIAAVDIFHEGLLMAPVTAIPRLLARNGLVFDDIALWEIHEAFSAQVLCHIKGLEDKDFVRAKAGVENNFGRFPRERMNPNGGSVALGHPFAATGARILSQAVKELAAMPAGSRAIVSVCADGGLGSVALLQT
ncbi:MAG TPA: acetyl-CoA C-acyltransferase [Xanthobacteraceae bacterium]|jgi:acetyl-CoA C-acetyltransferase|nr:acetyl-CoA C-acyltransferase [Xanthobacteraceae bacterium]